MMSSNLFKIGGTALVAASFAVCSVDWSIASAQDYGQRNSDRGGAVEGRQHGMVGQNNTADVQKKIQPPHGGQISVVPPFTFEVVYRPRELRVYVYEAHFQSVAINNVKGAIAFRLPQSAKPIQIALKHVPQPRGSKTKSYLAATGDWSNVKDGQMKVAFLLDGLPQPHPTQVKFIQTFALTKVKPEVVVAKLTEADRAGIERQGTCPVSGQKLGGMGDPIKVLIDGQPLYLCCRGCLAKVKKDPEKYLEKVKPLHSHSATHSPQKP